MKKRLAVVGAIVVLGISAGLLSGCNQAHLWLDRATADQFAQTAFTKFRAREFRQLPMISQFDEAHIKQGEVTAALLPTQAPLSSRLVDVEIASDELALVRRQYVYPDKTLELAVGMQRDSAFDGWRLAGLSVTPADPAR